MNKRRTFKGFTLIEMVIVLGVIAILAAVMIPSFIGIIRNTKVTATYERATNVRNDFFLESDEFDSLSDMSSYLILVDGKTVYEINENGELVASGVDFEEYVE